MSADFADLLDWRVERDGQGTVFRQIYGAARHAILAGTLAPGARLPSSRALASRLGVSRASVVVAYELLEAEGYVASRAGAGAFVRADFPSARAPRPSPTPRPAPPALATAGHDDPRPFNTGRTRLDARAISAWKRVSARTAAAFGPRELGYGDPAGQVELRALIADYLRAARGVRCEADQILVTSGAQHALDIIARVLIEPGDTVWVEDPGYMLTHRALEAARAVLCPVPVDADGLRVAEGRAAAPGARAAFVTPSHQFPTGVTLSMPRRLELIAWAREAGAWVIEDDYASEFRYDGPPLAALQGLDDAERVIYVGTLNKALFPGLRLGYLAAPRGIVDALVHARNVIDRQPPSLSQAAAAAFMREGHFAGHLRRTRLRYRDQRDALAEALRHAAGDAVTVHTPDQGMHLVAYLNSLDDVAVESAAADAGLVVRAISRLYRAAQPRSGLILGFSGHTPDALRSAAAQLAQVIKAQR